LLPDCFTLKRENALRIYAPFSLITVTLTEPFSFDDLLNQINRQGAEDTWEYAVL
jgi:hypothetical protein